jgi:hypothetical protein
MACLVAYSDKTIKSLVDEMDKFSALFELSLKLKTKNHATFL